MNTEHETLGRDIADAERQLAHMIKAGQIVPEAVYAPQLARLVWQGSGAFYEQEIDKAQNHPHRAKALEPFSGLEPDELEHLVVIEASGMVRFAFNRIASNTATPVTEWHRTSKGKAAATLAAGVDRLVEVVYPMVGKESPSKLAAFWALERNGARRIALVNLTVGFLDLLVATRSGQLSQIVRFTRPLRGISVPGVDLTRAPDLH